MAVADNQPSGGAPQRAHPSKTAMSIDVPDSPERFARELQARFLQSEKEGFVPWTDAELDAWALRLFSLQVAGNPAYGAWCRAGGRDPSAVSDWRAIPAVPTDAFKALDLTSLRPTDRTACFHSSGTTGQTLSQHHHSEASLELYRASLGPWFRHHLLDGFPRIEEPGARPVFVNLVPEPSLAPNSSLAFMLGAVTAAHGSADSVFVGRIAADGGWDVELERAVALPGNLAEEGRAVVVLGTAFGFVHLLDALAARNRKLRLPAGSRAMETGGYKGRSRTMPKADLHRAIRDGLGVPDAALVTEYGMSELGSQAYDRVAVPGGSTDTPRLLRFPPWCRARIVSSETGDAVAVGEMGVVRVLDLANVWSVAAVQTGDIARRHADGFELIGRAVDAEPRGCSLMAT